jgi:type I restriction enzyme S subunit
MVEKGDILFALYGANSGDVAIARLRGVINQAILCLRSNSSNQFIFQFLSHRKDWIVSNYIQGGQGNLSGEIVKSLKVPFPKPKEQQKIASCLSSLDDLIAAHSQKLEALKDHKKGLMQQLFPADGATTPSLRFKEFEESGEWEEKMLGTIAKNLNNKRTPVTQGARIKGDIPYYGASGVIDYVKEFLFNEDILCISEDGANLVARTYPIAFSVSGKSWVNNHAHVLRFKKKCTLVLVENYLNAISLVPYLTGMAQPKLNRAKLDIIPIPLPGPEEQQKIASCLSSLDALIAAQAEKVEALKEHKKGLMQGLFPAIDRSE